MKKFQRLLKVNNLVYLYFLTIILTDIFNLYFQLIFLINISDDLYIVF